MAINTLSNASSQEVRVKATKAVSSGDLLTLFEGGAVYPASTALSIVNQNVTTAGISAVMAYQSIAGSNYQTFQERNNAVQLGNNAIAWAYAGNGTTANTGVNVGYMSPSGGAYQPTTSVVTTASISSVRIKKLTETTFVVAWIAGTALRFAIYNNDGTVVAAATTVIATIGSTGPLYWNFTITAASDIVITYWKSTSNDLAFQRYNSSGVLQGAEVIVETASSPQYINILSHSSGDFWISYYRSAATAGTKFARYNSTGTLQGSLTTVLSGSGVFGINIQNTMFELSNNTVLIWVPNASSYANAYIYSSTGVLNTSNTTWHGSATITAGTCPGVAIDSSGFYFAYANSSSNMRIQRSNNSFQFFGAPITTVYNPNVPTGTGAGFIDVYIDGSNGFTLASGGFSGANTYGTIAAVSLNGSTLGSVVQPYTAAAAINGFTSFITNEGLLYFSSQSNATTVSAAIYNTSRKSFIGIAQETVSAGANVRCATTGTFTVNNPPLSPGYFDNRTATPGGCRGTIAGTTAILSGTV